MNKFVYALVVAVSVSVSPVQAENVDELSVKLVDAMDYCTMLNRTLEEMKATQLKQMKSMITSQSADIEHDINRTFELIKEVLDCESMKKETAAIYAELFSEEELKGLIEFYNSDLGKTFSAKQPDLMRRSMELSMGRMQTAMPKIMQQIQEEKKALEASKKAVTEPVTEPAAK